MSTSDEAAGPRHVLDGELDWVDLRGVSMRGARLLRCTLEGANWEGADLTDADVAMSMFPAKPAR